MIIGFIILLIGVSTFKNLEREEELSMKFWKDFDSLVERVETLEEEEIF